MYRSIACKILHLQVGPTLRELELEALLHASEDKVVSGTHARGDPEKRAHAIICVWFVIDIASY